ncbi:MAG: FAD-dependent oxidoreductase [Spirochaetales bacterium]|nr:FAD-dependent oxidoreductase [Spirochaetales bacterium]
MTDKIKEINAQDWEKEVLKQDKVIVDFYSTECPPCEALASKYDSLSQLYGDDVKFIKIFRQGNRELSEKLGVSSSPTILFYEKDQERKERFSGAVKRSDLMQVLGQMVGPERNNAILKQIKPKITETDVLILGAGPAGLTAGLYLAQAQVKTILVDKALPGGYVSTTHLVSNYPGFIEAQQGFMLSHYMSEQAKEAGVEYRAAVDVSEVNLKDKSLLVDGYERIKAKKLIIATGSSPRPLGLKGEIEYRGNGISYCSTCDAKYFKDKEVIVIGGGNSAIEESLFIAKFASKLTIVHQFDHFQANKIAQDKLKALDNVELYLEHEPREFIKHGNMDMEVKAENLKTGELVSIRAAGVFVFVGFIANTSFIQEDVNYDKWGYITADEMMRTTIPGVFAVGDIRSKSYRQITTAVADGTIAALTAAREIDEEK